MAPDQTEAAFLNDELTRSVSLTLLQPSIIVIQVKTQVLPSCAAGGEVLYVQYCSSQFLGLMQDFVATTSVQTVYLTIGTKSTRQTARLSKSDIRPSEIIYPKAKQRMKQSTQMVK